MNGFRFILQPYKGKSTRYECPSCHQAHCFTRYIDTWGTINFPDYVGKCEHLNKCGYHYPPKKYFQENPTERRKLVDESDKMPPVPHVEKPKVEPYFFNLKLMEETEKTYENNDFFIFITKNFGYDNAIIMFKKYHVGTSEISNGATVFWRVDTNGRICDGKIMFYNAETGHRLKDFQHHVNWYHSLRNIDLERIHRCFFGEHLIPSNRDKPIAIVESEKTAIIASFYLPQYVWISPGGKDGMFSMADYSIFRNHEVTMFPDLGMLENWKGKSITLQRHGIKAACYTFLEQNASDSDKAEGLDIADFLLQKNPREFLLSNIIKHNPEVGLLVEKLGMEISK